MRAFIDWTGETYKMKPGVRSVLLFLGIWPIVLGFRICWQTWPGLPFCILFWAVAKLGDPVFMPRLSGRRRALHMLAFIGGSLNAIATLANGGYMPVLGKATASSVWIPLTDATRVKALCDIYGTCSIGDMFIFTALFGFLLNRVLEKAEVFEPSSHGERMPGLGI